MNINRKTALFFLIINMVLVAYYCFVHFYFSETIFVDFNQPSVQLSAQLVMILAIAEFCLKITIYFGMIWLIWKLGERKWLILLFGVFVLFHLIGLIFPMAITSNSPNSLFFVGGIYYIHVILVIFMIK